MKVTVVVATHKPYGMPADPLYLPLHVGAEGKESIGFAGDNTGEHISAKNPQFCELTGLYWAWKNLDADHLGLVHYRRYFGSPKKTKATPSPWRRNSPSRARPLPSALP